MKIQIHSGNFFPEKTGIGKYTGEMAAWLAKRGHEVEVITGYPYYPEWKLSADYDRTRYLKEQWNGVTIHRVPHYIPRDGRVTSLRRILVDLSLFLASAVRWLAVIFRKRKPDVVIAVCPPLFAGVWPWVVSRLCRVPWVYHIQDFQVDAAMRLGMLRGSLLGRLLFGIENRLIRSATRVSSITPAMCRRAASKGAREDRMLELPNWSDIRNIRPSASDTAFRRDLGLASDQLLVMYAGAMGRKQGLELVLDAAERLLGNARFHFAMIGSGSDAEALKEAALRRGLDNMKFLPLQPVERLNEMLASGDIHLVVQKAHAADLVMPSKLTNILAAGRPVLATAEEGTALWDAVEAAGTGLVVLPEALDPFVAALEQLAANPALRQRCGINAREFAEQQLDQDAILARFEQQLMALAPRARAQALEVGSDARESVL